MIDHPVGLLLVFCVLGVCLSVAGAIACQTNDKCKDDLKNVDMPLAAVCLLVACMCLFAVFYVERGMGRRTGLAN